MKNLPYFDYLLAFLKNNNETVEKSFGRHVHWGYWETPEKATLSIDDFVQATENLSKMLISAAKITDGQKVLDVGCGFGGTIASLNETHTGLDLVGINIDDRQLERARQKIQAIGNNTIEFQQGDACALPFLDNSFDVVLAVECVFHFPSREQFIKEAYRVLKPGGFLALSDFIPGRFSPLRLSGQFNSSFFGACDVRYTIDNYHALAKKTGFTLDSDKNITQNTLPTYRYLKSLLIEKDRKKTGASGHLTAFFTTLAIEIVSRLNLLSYFVFSFRKPA